MSGKSKITAHGVFYLVAFLLFSVAPAFSASLENLDELAARKSRLSSASVTRSVFEGTAPNYYWQAETLSYTDITYGSEVWRLTYQPARDSMTSDISNAQWNANGNRLAFGSNRQTVAFPTATTAQRTWMLVNTDGSRLRTGYELSNYNWNRSNFPAWNPAKENTLYMGGWGPRGTSYSVLYVNTIADSSISISPLLSVDSSQIRRMYFKKAISGDGKKLLVTDFDWSLVWPVDLTTVTLECPPAGYSKQLPWDTYWGDSKISPTSPVWHDQFVAGAVGSVNGVWNYHLPNGTYTWWRNRLSGTGANNMPLHRQDHSLPYDWGNELEPIGGTNTGNDPFSPKVDYISHFSPDRWGAYGIFSKTQTAGYGTSLINLTTHGYWNPAKVFTAKGESPGGVQHHDWEAWSDWSVSSYSPKSEDFADYRTHKVATQNYKDPASQRVVVSGHTLTNTNGTDAVNHYNSILRPSQSPDGTKVMFHSDFLNADPDANQLYWAVAYYPYPPEIKNAAKNGSTVRLTWDFNQGTAGNPNFVNPRTYATRGWPHETNDRPPSPREIDKFRVWVSSDNLNWNPLGTSTYDNCRGSNECGLWAEESWTYDAVQKNGTRRYYAVTSMEFSGLESRTVGNVWMVTLDNSGNIAESSQSVAYPGDPGSASGFYTVAPNAPKNVSFSYKQAPADADGQYTIRWNAPTDATMIRYYNIYAADGSLPSPVQQNRIASIPASSDYDGTGSFKYVDWAGNTDGSTKYIITSVDYQGNESVPDSIAPTVSLVYPVASDKLSGTVAVTASANDNVGVEKVEFYINSVLLSTSTAAPYIYSFNTKDVANGTYTLKAMAYDAAGNSGTSSRVTITISNATSAPTAAYISPSANSASGTVTFNASAAGGSGNYVYQFWVLNPAGAWSIVQAYSANSSFTWNTAGLAPGGYLVDVWVKNSGSTATYETYKAISYTINPPASSVNMTSASASPQRIGSNVTFNASATGGSGNYVYQYWVLNPAGTWSIVQAYGANSSFTWNTAGLAPGSYLIDVWAKNSGSSATYESYKAISYTIYPAPASSVNMTSASTSPQRVGSSVTFNASAAGGSGNYVYQFWVLNPAGAWSVVQAYSANSSFTWNTAGLAPGNYLVDVWAKSAGSTANYEAFTAQVLALK